MSRTTSLREMASKSGFPLVRTLRERLRGLRLRRGAIWTLIWVAMGGAAVYFLLPEVGGLGESLRALEAAQPGWLVAGAGFVALRYVMAVLSLRAAVGQPLPFGPTLLVQMSSSFVGRFTPEGIGWLVLNQRYLERLGLGRVPALAAITLKVLAGAVTRLLITAAVAALVGTSGIVRLEIPDTWPYLLAIALGVALIGLILLAVFRSAASRMMVPVVAGARDLASVVRQPRRAAALFGSSAGLTISYGLVLAASVMACGGEVSLLAVFAVYLGGTAVASVSPTPGNVGAVEVVLSAGLTTVGVAPASAVAAVLIYRLFTFWLPVAPGFVAFRFLQQKDHI
jgi:undecaprenyl-diphosphatase